MSGSTSNYRKLFLLMMSSKRHIARLCEQHGMTPVQGMLLILFEPGQAKSMNELSCRMGCDASNVTGLIDRLDAQGLIERTVDAKDRRVKMIQLSKVGLQRREELLLGLEQAEAIDLSKLTAQEKEVFTIVLDKLTANKNQQTSC